MKKHTCIASVLAGVLFLGCQNHAADTQDERPIDWVSAEVRAPGVQQRVFKSNIVKSQVSYHIYVPPQYESEKARRFPVLYWLHGTSGGLPGIIPLSSLFDRAIREGRIPPMLVVFPNGLVASMWCNSKDGEVPMETVLLKELVPHIDATYRSLAKHEGRLIEGFSMGGYGAARLGLKYPNIFGSISILAGGPFDLDFKGPRARRNPAERERILRKTFGGDIAYFREQNPHTVAEQNADAVRNRSIIRIIVGKRDNSLADNQDFSKHLRDLKIEHAYWEVPGVGHKTLPLLNKLGESNWEFYRTVFGRAEQVDESGENDSAQQDGADQLATPSESKPEGDSNPELESERRSQ